MENNKKWFLVLHEFDVDGGFGDAIGEIEPLFAINCTEEEVKQYCKDITDKESYVYDEPYNELECHRLTYQELATVDKFDNVNLKDYDSWKYVDWHVRDDEDEENET